MICASCRRDNHAARRYCGGCGCNFAPACDACGFANEAQDRFCGGCGQGLRAGEPRTRPAVAAVRAAVHAAIPSHIRPAQPAGQLAVPAPVPAPAPAATGKTAASPWDASELAELFAPAPVAEDSSDLPEIGIGQDDVDRLFGATP